MCKSIAIALVTLLSCYVAAQQNRTMLVVTGHPGEAPIVKLKGKTFVDLQALAQITNSSIRFEREKVVLSLPGSEHTSSAETHSAEGFSREFMSSGIEAIASMREWGTTLVAAIENGYPIGTAMAPFKGRATDALRAATAAAVTESDRKGLELLNREFTGVQSWSDHLVSARNSMSAANYTMSDDAVRKDSVFQNLVRCGQFLGSMFASGTFQDDGSCRM